MADAKPVYVHIDGASSEFPTLYRQLIDRKIACEKTGQPFLVIPEPRLNADGTPGSEPADKHELTDEAIRQKLAHYFGKGGAYEGREFIVHFFDHGETVKGGTHVVAIPNKAVDTIPDLSPPGVIPDHVSNSAEIYAIPLSIRNEHNENLCRGISTNACFGGASLISMAQAVKANPLTHPVDFFSSTSYHEKSLEPEYVSYLYSLSDLSKNGKDLTGENIFSAYLTQVHGFVPASVYHKTFNADAIPDPSHVSYRNMDKSLDFVIRHANELKQHYQGNEAAQFHLAKLSRFSSAAEAHESSVARNALEPVYGGYRNFARLAYDDYAKKKNLPLENAFLSPELIELSKYRISFGGLSSETIMEFAETGPPKLALMNHEFAKERLSPEQHKQFLDTALHRFKHNPDRSTTDWELRLTPDGMKEILQRAAMQPDSFALEHLGLLKKYRFPPDPQSVIDQSVATLSQQNGTRFLEVEALWKGKISPEQEAKAMQNAVIHAAEHKPRRALDLLEKLQKTMTPEMTGEIRIKAVTSAATKDPMAVFHHKGAMQLPQEMLPELYRTAANSLLKDDALALVRSGKPLEEKLGREAAEQFVSAALAKTTAADSDSLLSGYGYWQNYVKQQDQRPILSRAIETLKKDVQIPTLESILPHMLRQVESPEKRKELFNTLKAITEEQQLPKWILGDEKFSRLDLQGVNLQQHGINSEHISSPEQQKYANITAAIVASIKSQGNNIS